MTGASKPVSGPSKPVTGPWQAAADPDPTIWREYGSPLLPPTGTGPLDGLSVAVKDLYSVTGFPTGAGNPAWLAQAEVEAEDAWAVRQLRAAGAAIAGIAQTDELAFSLSGTNAHYGTPPNTAAPDRVPGGSSSGPAAAVAAGQADIGLGSDTAGSVRVPASVCGLYGLRPTHAAVPVAGMLGLAPSFDVVGWLTRDAPTLQAVGEVLLPPGDVVRANRLLLPAEWADLLPRAAALATLLEVPVGMVELADTSALLGAFRTVQAAQAWQLRGDWIQANPRALSPDVAARFRLGSQMAAGMLTAAAAVIADQRLELLDQLGSDGWLVLPAAGGPGHHRDAGDAVKDEWRMGTLRCTVRASAFGLPSCVLPDPQRAGNPPTADTPPVGLALLGPPNSDRALLAAAVAIARGVPGSMR